MFDAKGIGLLDLLDEEARFPQPNAQHFTASVHQHHRYHVRLTVNNELKERFEL